MRRFDRKTRQKFKEIARKIKEKNDFAENADYQQARQEYVRQQSETVRRNFATTRRLFAFEGQGSIWSTEVWAALRVETPEPISEIDYLRLQRWKNVKKIVNKISPA